MRVAAAALLFVTTLAGCSGGGANHAGALPPGSVSLPGLPAQGLIVPRSRGVALIGLDGHVVARLPRFDLSPPSIPTRHDQLMHDLDGPGMEQPRLVTPSDRYYRLDASRHALIPVPEPRVPLPGGAELVGGGDPDTFRGLTVVRGDHVLVRRDLYMSIVAGKFVQSRGRLLDLRTLRSWALPPRCIGAGAHGDVAYAFCATGPLERSGPGWVEPYPHTWLERLTYRHPAAKVAEFSRSGPPLMITAALSPNGRFVAEQGDPACAGGFLFVGPTDGSLDSRLISGDKWTKRSPFSTFIGWSTDGRVVAHMQWGDNCERPSKEGVYLIDPRTMKRTFVTRSAWVMWNAFP